MNYLKACETGLFESRRNKGDIRKTLKIIKISTTNAGKKYLDAKRNGVKSE